MLNIKNFWDVRKINTSLSYHMQMQFDLLPHFKILESDEGVSLDMEKISYFKKFQNILIFGIGGSSLGGQMLYQFNENKNINLHFIDNIDPKTFNEKLSILDLKKTGVICISKSGNTAETLMQTMLAKNIFEKELADAWGDHFSVLTEKKDSALRFFAEKHNLLCLDHDLSIGGRFCVFTNVGAIVCALCDIDFVQFRQGARDLLKQPLDDLLQGAEYIVESYRKNNVNQSVMLVYADSLEMFSQWYGQLWGESLGKMKDAKHIGITPVSAVGAVDQHSQLQLYLDGPRDKLISFITSENHEKTDDFSCDDIDHPAMANLNGKTMAELFIAEQRGTLDAIKQRGCHVRQFDLPKVDIYHLGQLVMYQMIETIATAHLLEIDPFDQPAVEDSKIRAMEYLKKI